MAAPTKEYGLIKRNVTAIQPKLSFFDDDSDEEGPVSVGKALQKEAAKFQSKRQVKIDIQNALSEDPTVFEYDEIYDDMLKTKEQQTTIQKQAKEKKPQYIGALLKAAKVRKLEQERAVERKVQKEREAEGEQYAGKDSFVTSAYRQKMLELQEFEEKERHEAQIEALTDVTKQKDLSGFYRNLYRQTLNPHQKPSTSTDDTTIVKEEKETTTSATVVVKSEPSSPPRRQIERQARQFRRRQSSSSSSGSSSSSEQEAAPKKAKTSTKPSGERGRSAPRKSKGDGSSSDSGEVTTEPGKTSVSAPTADGNNSPEMKGKLRSPIRKNSQKNAKAGASWSKSRERENNGDNVAQIEQSKNLDQDDDNIDADDSDSDSDLDSSGDEGKKLAKTKNVEQDKRTPREKLLALFMKRTVGPALDAALERYFIRKNARLVAAN